MPALRRTGRPRSHRNWAGIWKLWFVYLGDSPGMAADPQVLHDDHSLPPGLTMERVGDAEMLRVRARVA